jgi:hypothetical protein
MYNLRLIGRMMLPASSTKIGGNGSNRSIKEVVAVVVESPEVTVDINNGGRYRVSRLAVLRCDGIRFKFLHRVMILLLLVIMSGYYHY